MKIYYYTTLNCYFYIKNLYVYINFDTIGFMLVLPQSVSLKFRDLPLLEQTLRLQSHFLNMSTEKFAEGKYLSFLANHCD
jgi:hypothetical protein